MATIAEQLTELQAVKSGLKTALTADGTDMSAVPFTDYPEKVQAITERWRSLVDGSITEIYFTGIKTLRAYICCACVRLESVTFSDDLLKIDICAFLNCGNLKSVTIPDSVTTLGSRAFDGCTRLTSITFGENSQLTSIGDKAFSECGSLTSITIPVSVTQIKTEALNVGSSSKKATIIMKPTTPPRIASNTIGPYVTKIIVPIGTGDTYKAASVWSNYASIIEEETV